MLSQIALYSFLVPSHQWTFFAWVNLAKSFTHLISSSCRVGYLAADALAAFVFAVVLHARFAVFLQDILVISMLGLFVTLAARPSSGHEQR
jgi:hypothetical protein